MGKVFNLVVTHCKVSGSENSKLFVLGCAYSFSVYGKGGVSLCLLQELSKIKMNKRVVCIENLMWVCFILQKNRFDYLVPLNPCNKPLYKLYLVIKRSQYLKLNNFICFLKMRSKHLVSIAVNIVK